MDDSDQDFVDLCSKLLKRNRKKTVVPRAATGGDKRRNKPSKDDKVESQSSSSVGGIQTCGSVQGSVPGQPGTSAKEQVLQKMHKFKRASPQRMVLNNEHQIQQESQRPDLPELAESDEALAIRLQQELNRETRSVDLEDEGLFFCQLCNKDISHMTPEGRTQHINRCLDEREDHTAAPPPLPHGVIECPICGKRFKSQKNCTSHLKRCSSDMGVPPAVLIQALQRQAEESQSNNMTTSQIVGQKRKGSKSNMPASKKPRKKVGDLDEDTMMAMALSSSLLEQGREKQKELQAERESLEEIIGPSTSKSPVLKWKPHAEKRSDSSASSTAPGSRHSSSFARIQERVSALLLTNRAPSPPTPTRCTSSLPAWSEWSALAASGDKAQTPVQDLKLRTPVASILPCSSQTPRSSPAVSTPGTGQLPGCSQALRDLMELAEDGMTLTQYGYSTTELSKDQQTVASHTSNLQSSGCVVEEEEQNNPGVSGFLPEAPDDNHKDC
ncbi:hypothetical protein WMY93_006533 [Mugilogobius chulae]|uniref:C2H2-type domain-containing protein n=1 Tax=Mugilogobius chulae TaxID=88201 RepID=A0AAW0PZU9_9GOBI